MSLIKNASVVRRTKVVGDGRYIVYAWDAAGDGWYLDGGTTTERAWEVAHDMAEDFPLHKIVVYRETVIIAPESGSIVGVG